MNIKEEREKRGWSLEEVAVKIGVTVSSIYRWEMGTVKPHRIFQRKLEHIFKKGERG